MSSVKQCDLPKLERQVAVRQEDLDEFYNLADAKEDENIFVLDLTEDEHFVNKVEKPTFESLK